MSLDINIRNLCKKLDSRTYLYELYFTDPGDFFSADDAFCDIWKSHLIIMAVALLIFSLIYFVTRKNRRLMATGNRFHKDIVPEKCGPDIPKKMLELIKKGVETSYSIGQDTQTQRKREWLKCRTGGPTEPSHHPASTTTEPKTSHQPSYRDVVASMAALDGDTNTDADNNDSPAVVDEDTPLQEQLPSRIYSGKPFAMEVPPPQGIGEALEQGIRETSNSNGDSNNDDTNDNANDESDVDDEYVTTV
eukprot:m.141401 g.141401  ORF g.141401 m.141401 type:complete len:248 (+) comp30186_c1_seq1:339-1082(+)